MRIFLICFLVLFLVVVGGFVILGPSSLSNSGWFAFEKSGLSVRLMTVEPGVVREVVTAPGEVEPDVKVDISAEVSARIESLPLREGDQVKKGDLVVKLDDRELRAILKSSKARRDAEFFRLQSEQARLAGPLARLAAARRQLERNEQLFETGDVSRLVLEQAQESVDDLSAQVDAAKHAISVIESSLVASDAEIARSEEALARTEIRAPMDGVVTTLNAEIGELVMVGTMNNAGTVILRVADLSSMHLDARVAESDVSRVLEGQAAEVRINAYRNEVFQGDVTRVALQRMMDNAGAGYFNTEINLQLDGRRIYSGLAANVEIRVGDHEGLVVPSQAIVDRAVEDLPSEVAEQSRRIDPNRSAVSVIYKVVDSKAVCALVEVGPSSLTETLLVSGVSEGDQIVVGPYKVLEKIKDGDLVEEVTGALGASESSGEDESNMSIEVQ